MDVLEFLPIVLYLLGIALLIILIILGIKLIHTVDKTNDILDDAYNKSKSLDGVFDAIDNVTDALSTVSDTVVGALTSFVGRVFSRKKSKKKESEEDE